MVFLETDRLRLRLFRADDFDSYRAYAADPDLGRMIGLEDLTNPAALRRAFERMLRQDRCYAIILKESGQIIGDLSIDSLPPFLRDMGILRNKKGAALSFSLSANYRRRGLMTEAVTGVLDQLFLREQFDYVNCGYFDFNESSKQLQAKLGFVCLATHPYRRGLEGFRVIDNVMWREKWLEQRGGAAQ